MADRRFVAWFAGLIALALATLGVATWILWWASDLMKQVDEFYRSLTGSLPVAPDVAGFYDQIGSNAYSMTIVASPLLAGAVLAIIAAIAVLARRWEVRHP